MTEESQNPLPVLEVSQLYERLSQEQRHELLQCLLGSATRGGEAMIQVLGEMLLCHATAELIHEHSLGRP